MINDAHIIFRNLNVKFSPFIVLVINNIDVELVPKETLLVKKIKNQ